MANPKIGLLTELFLPDGYGYFQYGSGVYGGYSEILNPQWNTNSGSYGINQLTDIPYIAATSSPSYVGASSYSAEYSSFFCRITPAGPGNGTVQTAVILRADSHNYAEMSVGPAGVFNAYVADDTSIVLPTTRMPLYDPVAHAFWRIRNDDAVLFHFDASPDGVTWTELCSVPYTWDASSVTVMLFAGFTGSESQDNYAYVSNINVSTGAVLTSALYGARSVLSAKGYLTTTPAAFITGRLTGNITLSTSVASLQALPEGGLTDFSYSTDPGTVDPLMVYGLAGKSNSESLPISGALVTQASWGQMSYPYQVTQYRDNTYWPSPQYMSMDVNLSSIVDSNPVLITSNQIEETTGLNNRLSLDAYIYDTACCYSAAAGVSSVTRVTSPVLTGQYSGKVVGSGANSLLTSGSYAYYLNPESTALVPVSSFQLIKESFSGSVALNTTRANTQWFVSLVFFDSNFGIINQTTYKQPTITNMNTHPGNGVWQTGNVTFKGSSLPNDTFWVGVVPVVVVPSPSTAETVYVSNHVIQGVSAWVSEQPSPYTNPRTANVNVKADRINYCANSGFNTNTTLWFQTNTASSGTPNPVTLSWDGTTGYGSLGSMELSFVAPSGSFTGSTGGMGASTSVDYFGGAYQYPPVQGLLPGHTYMISSQIRQSVNCPDVYMNFYDSNFVGFQELSTNTTKVVNPDSIDGQWTRISYPYTVPPEGLTDYGMFFFVLYSDYINATKPFSFWVDDILVEESTSLNPYFDGSFPSVDYMWELNSTPNLCRSYYYKDYSNKYLRLTKALPGILPVGEYYNLIFANAVS